MKTIVLPTAEVVEVGRDFRGFSCFFNLNGQEYLADISLSVHDHEVECMIFKSECRQVSDWYEDFCRRGLPFTVDSLVECVNQFITERMLYNN